MQTYKAPINDIKFALESLGYDRVASIPQFEDFDLETIASMAEEAGIFCANEMLPCNGTGDREGVSFNPETQEVTTPSGFKELWDKFRETGFAALCGRMGCKVEQTG